MLSERELTNRMLLQARDAIDRDFGEELDLLTLAGIAGASRPIRQHDPHRPDVRRSVGLTAAR